MPLTDSTAVKLPVPLYGAVPPVAETVQMNGLPVVIGAAVLHVTVTTRGCGATVMLSEPIAEAPLASVTAKLSVKVPLTASDRENVPVPLYGVVPPVAETVQLNGLPAVCPEPQSTDTTSG